MIDRKLAISSLLILGLSAGERTDNCPAPWSSKWGKKFKKSFRDFFKYPNHKGTETFKIIGSSEVLLLCFRVRVREVAVDGYFDQK